MATNNDLYKAITSGFTSTPEDDFSLVDISKAVSLDIKSHSSTIGLSDVADIVITSKGLALQAKSTTKNAILDAAIKLTVIDILNIEQPTAEEYALLKAGYEAIQSRSLKSRAMELFLSKANTYAKNGDIYGIYNIGGVVGNRVLSSSNPSLVTTALKSFKLSTHGVNLNAVAIKELAATFFNDLNTYDPNWNKTNNNVNVINLDLYKNASKDTKELMKYNTTQNKYLTISKVLDVFYIRYPPTNSQLIKQYRKYI